MKISQVVLPVVLSAFIVTGCTHELSRSEAEDLIQAAHFKDGPIQDIRQLFVSRRDFNGQFDFPLLDRLKYSGLITWSRVGSGYTVELTEKGQSLSTGPVKEAWNNPGTVIGVIGAERKFGRITGLKPINENHIVVEYTVECEVSPFGKDFGIEGGEETKEVICARYDDGWRIIDEDEANMLRALEHLGNGR